ncbi:Hypothetical predicted protein [Octopus vulgaris]|uniref:Uncharacterized protein n=1 Tax=Octopus vulgaris TaxID=6645 RepID=A0AA36C1E9_OCTVU|nr:Hypothetical predicted protein [Octopus vulgaris]
MQYGRINTRCAMAQEVELEEFRSQWRKELGSQNVSMAHPKKIPKKNMPPDSDKQRVSWSKLDGSKKIEGRAASLLLQVTESVNDVVYQPFVIVGQLLKEGTCPNSNTETDLDRWTLDNTSRPSKRSYFDSALESNDETQGREKKKKKKKTANCDEGKRRESFIDYLVADLVRLGRVRSLLYVQAGVLSAASFHKDTVVAGFC